MESKGNSNDNGVLRQIEQMDYHNKELAYLDICVVKKEDEVI
jgi:hypothetical protein